MNDKDNTEIFLYFLAKAQKGDVNAVVSRLNRLYLRVPCNLLVTRLSTRVISSPLKPLCKM